jgi:hypothetical protein
MPILYSTAWIRGGKEREASPRDIAREFVRGTIGRDHGFKVNSYGD